MLNVLATGTLVADPRSRQGSSGHTFVTASLRVPCEGGDAALVSLIAFDRVVMNALLGLSKGDALAVAGRAKLTSWDKNGEQHHGLSVIADQILTIYEADRRRKRARNDEAATA